MERAAAKVLSLVFLFKICESFFLYCSSPSDCESQLRRYEVPILGVLRCIPKDDDVRPVCAERDNDNVITFISIQECSSNEKCQELYPTHPVCNLKTGNCEPRGGGGNGCRSNQDCRNGEICKNGQCKKGCYYNSDCPTRPSAKAICKLGECKYILINCENDSHCENGMSCYKGRCLPMGCSKDEDCKVGSENEKFICNKKVCVQTLECFDSNDCRRRFGRTFVCMSGLCKKKLENSDRF